MDTSDPQTLDLRQESMIDFVILYGAAFLFLLTVVLAGTQVFVRTVLIPLGSDIRLVWTEPAARVTLVILTFWGAAVCSRNKEHIRVNVTIDAVREKSEFAYKLLWVFMWFITVLYVGTVLLAMNVKIVDDWGVVIGGLGAMHMGHVYTLIAGAFLCILIFETIDFGSRIGLTEWIEERRSSGAGSGEEQQQTERGD